MAVVSGYSSAQMLAMQKDAIRRVNEMQRQAQERLRQTQEILEPPPQEADPPAEEPAGEAEPSNEEEPAGRAEPSPAMEEGVPAGQPPGTGAAAEPSPGMGILQRLGLDEESILLILLLILLINEGADSKLILALVYVLL